MPGPSKAVFPHILTDCLPSAPGWPCNAFVKCGSRPSQVGPFGASLLPAPPARHHRLSRFEEALFPATLGASTSLFIKLFFVYMCKEIQLVGFRVFPHAQRTITREGLVILVLPLHPGYCCPSIGISLRRLT